MALNLKRCKTASINQEYPVFGYMRRIESKLSSNIPVMIKYICLNYYMLTEYFTEHGKYIDVNINESKSIGKAKQYGIGSLNTIYGKVVIDTNDTSIKKYRWKFSVNRGYIYHDMMIGIDSSNKLFTNESFVTPKNQNEYYAFHASTTKYCKGKVLERGGWPHWNTGDKVEMVLDVINESLELYNGDELVASWTDVILKNTKYHLAITMLIGRNRYNYIPQQIQLIDFKYE